MNIVKEIIIGTVDTTGALHHVSQFYLTLHINSLKIRLLNHYYSAVGAIVFADIGIRHYQYFLPISYRSRGQLKFHISNAQIFDLHFVDTTNTKDFFQMGHIPAPHSVQGKSPNGRCQLFRRLGRQCQGTSQ